MRTLRVSSDEDLVEVLTQDPAKIGEASAKSGRFKIGLMMAARNPMPVDPFPSDVPMTLEAYDVSGTFLHERSDPAVASTNRSDDRFRLSAVLDTDENVPPDARALSVTRREEEHFEIVTPKGVSAGVVRPRGESRVTIEFGPTEEAADLYSVSVATLNISDGTKAVMRNPKSGETILLVFRQSPDQSEEIAAD